MSLHVLEPLQGELSISVLGKHGLDWNLNRVSRTSAQIGSSVQLVESKWDKEGNQTVEG